MRSDREIPESAEPVAIGLSHGLAPDWEEIILVLDLVLEDVGAVTSEENAVLVESPGDGDGLEEATEVSFAYV
jgi:hypothetical protein